MGQISIGIRPGGTHRPSRAPRRPLCSACMARYRHLKLFVVCSARLASQATNCFVQHCGPASLLGWAEVDGSAREPPGQPTIPAPDGIGPGGLKRAMLTAVQQTKARHRLLLSVKKTTTASRGAYREGHNKNPHPW